MKYTFLAIIYAISLKCYSQTVLNVRAFEEDGSVMVLYDLFTTKSEKEFYITLKYSRDGGKIFIPILDANGDANKNVRIGSERSILWQPSSAPTDAVLFKVEAEPRKSLEKMINPNANAFSAYNSGEVRVAKVQRANAEIEFTFLFTSGRVQGNVFIAANFSIIDDSGQTYREATVIQGDKAGGAVICEPGSSTQFKAVIKNVPPGVTKFRTVEFSLSEIPVRLSEIKIEQ